jgi:hypothetical protein
LRRSAGRTVGCKAAFRPRYDLPTGPAGSKDTELEQIPVMFKLTHKWRCIPPPLIVRRSERILRQRSGMVRSVAFRRSALSLLKTCSIGLRSGEYGLNCVRGFENFVRGLRMSSIGRTLKLFLVDGTPLA